MTNAPPRQPKADSDALAHDQLRDARDGIERSGRSDKGQRTPHERDESPDKRATGEQGHDSSREVMKRAVDDLEQGREDTEARGTPSNPPSSADNRAPGPKPRGSRAS